MIHGTWSYSGSRVCRDYQHFCLDINRLGNEKNAKKKTLRDKLNWNTRGDRMKKIREKKTSRHICIIRAIWTLSSPRRDYFNRCYTENEDRLCYYGFDRSNRTTFQKLFDCRYVLDKPYAMRILFRNEMFRMINV